MVLFELPVGSAGLLCEAEAPPAGGLFVQVSAILVASCTLKVLVPLCAFTEVLSAVFEVPRSSTSLLTIASRLEVFPVSW